MWCTLEDSRRMSKLEIPESICTLTKIPGGVFHEMQLSNSYYDGYEGEQRHKGKLREIEKRYKVCANACIVIVQWKYASSVNKPKDFNWSSYENVFL
jgi:hypothetical protein